MALSLIACPTQSMTGNTTALTFSLTVQVGDVLVFKGVFENGLSTLNLPTTTGETWVSRGSIAGSPNPANNCWACIATMVATSAGTKTVTVSVSGTNGSHAGVVEQWRGAQLAASPVVASTANGGSAPSLALTTAANGSVIGWVSADWNAVAHTTITYRGSATGEFVTGTAGTDYFVSFAWQNAPTAGSQTFGMTAPTGQLPTMMGIEIQSAGGSTGATVAAVPATASAIMRPPTVSASGGTGATVTAVPATASAIMRPPAVAASRSATVTAVPATASASMPVPVIAVATQVSGGGPATATAVMLPPTITAVRAATVQAVPAAATASMRAPAVSTGQAATVQAVAATAAASVLAPTVTAVRAAAVQAVAAVATASMPAPTITAGGSATVQAVAAVATASMPAPAVAAVRSATITAVAATATASMPAPSVSAVQAATVQAVAAVATAVMLAPAIGLADARNITIIAGPVSWGWDAAAPTHGWSGEAPTGNQWTGEPPVTGWAAGPITE